MREIPLIAEPSQSVQVILAGQECTLRIYQRAMLPRSEAAHESRLVAADRIYMDVDVGATRVVAGAVCLDRWSIVQHAQCAFRGKLAFVDTHGVENPRWEGLGQRWRLVYEEEKSS